MSACTGASVTVPEASDLGAFGVDGSAGGVVLSLARTTVGMFGATSFSAPLLTVAGDGLVSLILAVGGFVSLMCWTGWYAALRCAAGSSHNPNSKARASRGFAAGPNFLTKTPVMPPH